MVELRGVSYAAGPVPILRDVSAAFHPGAFHVVLGPNGAGKSTLLRIATGLLRPTAGTVTYGGRAVDGFTREALARRRAVLSQHVELAFPLPVHDVVMMGRYPHFARTPAPRDREIVDRALEMVGMADRRAQPYPTLSGGEQQKVQLARVLAQIWSDGAPDGTGEGASRGTSEGEDDAGDADAGQRVLFLDEPTSSLDVHYQIHLLDLARGLLAHGCTVVAVLHDLNTALQYGDRFFVLDGGRLVHTAESADDVPGELLERVFRVRAHRLRDPADGQGFWRFTL